MNSNLLGQAKNLKKISIVKYMMEASSIVSKKLWLIEARKSENDRNISSVIDMIETNIAMLK